MATSVFVKTTEPATASVADIAQRLGGTAEDGIVRIKFTPFCEALQRAFPPHAESYSDSYNEAGMAIWGVTEEAEQRHQREIAERESFCREYPQDRARAIHELAEALKTDTTTTSLDLSGSHLEDGEVRILVEALLSNKNSKLVSLNLQGNHIASRGARDIARLLAAEHIPLVALNLRDNCVCSGNLAENSYDLDGVRAIFQLLHDNKTKLAQLDLRGNGQATLAGERIGIRDWPYLFGKNTTLVEFSIDACDDSDVKELALRFEQNYGDVKLAVFRITDGSISDEGASYFTQVLKNIRMNRSGASVYRLTCVDLQGNRIGDAGAIALAMGLTSNHLTSLNLCGNCIGDVGAQKFVTVLERNKILSSLNLAGNRPLYQRELEGVKAIVPQTLATIQGCLRRNRLLQQPSLQFSCAQAIIRHGIDYRGEPNLPRDLKDYIDGVTFEVQA